MKKLVLVAVLVAWPSLGTRAAPVNPIYNDYPVQCGATYFLFWKGYEQKKQPAMAETYRRKFESLLAKATPILEARGLSKAEADAYMQDHIDTLAKLAEEDEYFRALIGFKRLCDGKFPESQ